MPVDAAVAQALVSAVECSQRAADCVSVRAAFEPTEQSAVSGTVCAAFWRAFIATDFASFESAVLCSVCAAVRGTVDAAVVCA